MSVSEAFEGGQKGLLPGCVRTTSAGIYKLEASWAGVHKMDERSFQLTAPFTAPVTAWPVLWHRPIALPRLLSMVSLALCPQSPVLLTPHCCELDFA
jgi:hypothetical protein